MITYQKFRIVINRIVLMFIYLCSFLALLPFVAILWDLLKHGLKHINLEFFTTISPSFTDAILANMGGESIPGGILNGILGSFFIVLIAILIAVPLGILTGIYLYENRKNKLTIVLQYINVLLYGAPSIVVGISVYVLIIKPLHSFSALAGGIALSIIVMPMIVRTTKETLNTLPTYLKEAGLALGGSYTNVMLKIVIPSAKDGLIAGVLISLSRALGETALLVVTALGSNMINWNLFSPTTSISLLIWSFFNNQNMIDLVWSASLFLYALVLSLDIVAKRIGSRWKLLLLYE